MPPKAGAAAQSANAAAARKGRLAGRARATIADAPTDELPGRQRHFQSRRVELRAQSAGLVLRAPKLTVAGQRDHNLLDAEALSTRSSP